MSERTILHVDIDAFFASVERLLNPALAMRPVIVGGLPATRGVVSSCTYDARALGVHAGMALSQASRLCPEGVFLEGDYRHYRRVRERIGGILLAFSPTVEFTSIDDAYVELTGLERIHGPPSATAERIRRAIVEKTGVSVSIGIGTSKLLARIASGCAKPAGIMRVLPGYERAFLREIGAAALPGVGRRTGAALDDLNVRTVGEIARIPVALMERVFGAQGRTIAERARGEDTRTVRERAGPASISRETTFPHETTSRREVESMLHYLTERAAAQLRRAGRVAGTLSVKVRYADHRGASGRCRVGGGGSDLERDLYQAALSLLRRVTSRRVSVRMVGVTLSDLGRKPEGRQQAIPFSASPLRDREEGLAEGIDRVRRRFGFGAVTAGRSIEMLGKVRRNGHGFVLRTPSLTR